MNKTKIEWTDYSWNPITGCLHNCWYCYAKKMFMRFHRSFEPTFHPERLNELDKLKEPCRVFVCSVADLFAEWTPVEWRNKVLETISQDKYSHITFQLLTKNPERIPSLEPRKNIWIGTTITSNAEMGNMDNLISNYDGTKFLSFEPLLSHIDYHIESEIDWIIIGKLTGSRRIPLQKEWVENIIKEARKQYIPIFIKNNVNWHEKIQDFPI